MAGHAPFAAQVILNGHEYVAIAAQGEGIWFTKEGNCFTGTTDPAGLAQIADTLSQDAAAGRLGQVIDRWIYTACLGFGLDLADQRRTCFRYAYSVYQAEYSRNLLFAYGGHMDRVFNAMLDRTRSRLDIPALRTLFGARRRPGKYGTAPSPRVGVVLETPAWDLTVFKVHFGLLTLKGYTKGARVLRFEAITHNTRQLGCGRALDRFPQIIARLAGMCQRFCTALDCVDTGFLPDGTLDQLPLPAQLGASRVGGIDVNQPRIRAALAAEKSLTAIAEWAAAAPAAVLAAFGVRRDRRDGAWVVPSETTIRRTLGGIDADALDAQVGAWLLALAGYGAGEDAAGDQMVIAVDGKTARGAKDKDGAAPHLLAAITCDEVAAIAQRQVSAKSNEIPAFAPLLRDLDLDGAVILADALHTQREHARFIVEDKHADYLFTIKENQPGLFDAVNALPWEDAPVAHTGRDRGHGRDETRIIQVLPAPGDLPFPHAAQVFLIERHVRSLDGSPRSDVAALGVTSLARAKASPARLAALARAEWTIENGLHRASETLRRSATLRQRCGYGPRGCWAWRQRLSC